jgi:hypothetical protein
MDVSKVLNIVHPLVKLFFKSYNLFGRKKTAENGLIFVNFIKNTLFWVP